jgi:hypothetical protein
MTPGDRPSHSVPCGPTRARAITHSPSAVIHGSGPSVARRQDHAGRVGPSRAWGHVSPLPANGEDYSAALLVMLNLADEDDPECSLVELVAVRITVHVEILNGEVAAFEESSKWSCEQRGAELARDDAKRCLALIARRQPDALHGTLISDLLAAAVVEAASESDPDDPEFVAEYTAECGRAASRIMRAIATHLEAEQRPSRRNTLTASAGPRSRRGTDKLPI